MATAPLFTRSAFTYCQPNQSARLPYQPRAGPCSTQTASLVDRPMCHPHAAPGRICTHLASLNPRHTSYTAARQAALRLAPAGAAGRVALSTETFGLDAAASSMDGNDEGPRDPYADRPALLATLRMLDWPEICSHVAAFASTLVGKRACQNLVVPESQEETEALLRQTK